MKSHAYLLPTEVLFFAKCAAFGADYTLHEWGTFTTVSGSDGRLLTGLEREEEALPEFVHSHAGMENQGSVPNEYYGRGKGWTRPVSNVTVKMETPVLYFYTTAPFEARVNVLFNGGSISQWYPDRSGGETPPPPNDPFLRPVTNGTGSIDFSAPYKGSIQWDVQVTPPTDSDASAIFRGSETQNWIIPRQTDAATVRVGKETEKFLFYRGIGNFPIPVRLEMPSPNTVVIHNTGSEAVPRLFVFEMGTGRSVRFKLLDSLAAGSSITVDLTTIDAIGYWARPVYESLSGALVEAGLYRKEADAMVQTWWKSYFDRPGVRVFWIAPRGFTEQTLPLKVEPAPKDLVRVIVGRSEILTPEFEKSLAERLAAKDYFLMNDRFLGAYQDRLRQLNPVK